MPILVRHWIISALKKPSGLFRAHDDRHRAFVAALLGVSYLHNFVLGPRVARDLRAGERRSYRRLQVVGWISFGLTFAVPVLGVALNRIAR